MMDQPVQIITLSDLYRFHRYVRANHIQGTVRQNQFHANARNTFSLALAIPLLSATLEIRGTNNSPVPFKNPQPYAAHK